MRLVSYFGPDDAGSGIVVGDRVIPLFEYAGIDLDPDALDDLRRRAATLTGAEGLAIDDLELVTPVIAPGKIVCVGLNYRDHASEGGRPLPTKPLLFSKFANAVVGDGEPIVRPEGTHALDLEVELGVVIGTTAHRVSRADALDHVAGYVVVNDVSARDWQGIPAALAEGEAGDGQWLRAKGSDTFLPMGSVLVTADEIPDPQNLRVRSWRIPGSGPDAGTEILMQDAHDRGHDLGRRRADRVHQPVGHPRPGRRHRDRHAVGRRGLPRSAGLPRAGRPGPLRDRRDRFGREPDHRLVRGHRRRGRGRTRR